MRDDMELRAYWDLLLRRWWLILGLPLLIAAIAFVLQPREVIQYRTTMKLAARPVLAAPGAAVSPGQNAYNEYLYSEYLLDDLMEIIKSPRFMADVAQVLRDRPGGPPTGAFDARKMRRVLTITAVATTAADASALAEAASRLLTTPDAPYVTALVSYGTIFSVVDPPATSAQVEARSVVNIMLRLVLGLAIGVAVALVLEALDDRLRTAREVRQLLEVPVLGEIPRTRRGVLVGQRRKLVEPAKAKIA